MIVAAGLGTRLHPLTEHRAKPAVPVRGIPMIAYSLAFLARAGVDEIVINVHHLPDSLIAAAQRWCPAHLKLQFSHEPELLHTGGAIRRVASFLRESDPCVVLGGDMILDFDLAAMIRRHREGDHAATLVLREDPRAPRFGTIGVDGKGCVRRVARRFDLGGANRAGVYTWANLFSPRPFESLPDALAREDGTRIEGDCVIGRGAAVGGGARLERVVVWDFERVPEGFEGADGVYAGGAFHPCAAGPDASGEALT
jgi:NDP-sugar pyrophosphorylase family protein